MLVDVVSGPPVRGRLENEGVKPRAEELSEAPIGETSVAPVDSAAPVDATGPEMPDEVGRPYPGGGYP